MSDATQSSPLLSALKDLARAYVNLIESGRERIKFLGGDCDPVDVMERGDPYLRKAREAIAAGDRKPDGYAYRYPSVCGGTVISFDRIGERVPVETIPYWLGSPIRELPASAPIPDNQWGIDEAFKTLELLTNGSPSAKGAMSFLRGRSARGTHGRRT